MQQTWEFLKGKKTYIVGAIVVLLYAAQHAGIQVPGVNITDQEFLTAVLGSTIRHGIG